MDAEQPQFPVRRIYETYIKPLPIRERLELIAIIARDLADGGTQASTSPLHRILELHGLGKEIWEGIDAQDYVNRLRDEWDRST